MKKSKLFYTLTLCLILASCSKDDGPRETTTSRSDSEINATEETALEADVVSQNIRIAAVEEAINGTPPTPNGAITLTLDSTNQTAFQKTGFEINFDAPANYGGTYLQIQAEDGTVAQDYFDIPFGAGYGGQKKINQNKTLGKKTLTEDDGDTTITIGFGAGIPPGKFCYIICVYDTDGNISLPQEVCVEVEAWGGNSAAVGTWNFVKNVDIENEVTTTYLAGEKECEDDYFYCESTQETIEVEEAYCDTTDGIILVLRQDGTFRWDTTGSYSELDYERSTASCTPVFTENQDDTEYGSGNWAYNEEENELTLIAFEYGDNGEVETYPEGEIGFVSKTTITSTSLILEIDDSYIADGITNTYLYKFYFSK